MTLVYHGTPTRKALDIAKRGAILSPLELFTEESQELGVIRDPESTLNYIASMYNSHELVPRVKSVAISTELRIARNYGACFEGDGGGIVLGIDVPIETLLKHFFNGKVMDAEKPPIDLTGEDAEIRRKEAETLYGNPELGKSPILFIPKRLEIASLKEVHVSRTARMTYGKELDDAFSRFSPKYLSL